MNTGGWCLRPTYTTYLAILKENNTENLSNNHRKPLQKLLSDRIPIIKLSWNEKAITKHPFSVTKISGIQVSFSHLWHQTSPFLHLAEINSFHMVINIHCKWMKHSLQDKTNMTKKLWYVTVLLVYLDTQNKMMLLWKHSHSNDIHIYSCSEHVCICGATITKGSVHFIQELSSKGQSGSLMTAWWVGDPPLARWAAPILLIDIMLKKLTCMMRVAEGINLNEKVCAF